MLTILTGDLGATATYAERTFAWVSDGSGFIEHTTDGGEISSIPAAGKLTIKLQHRHRRYTPVASPLWAALMPEAPLYKAGKPSGCEIDSYAVEEVEADQPPPARTFDVLNLTDDTQREPYRVTVGGENKCRCIAGYVGRYQCKHEAALLSLIAEGVLEPEYV